MFDDSQNPAGQATERFLGLLIANQRRVHAFILTLVPNRHDAEDLLQETIMAMWRKFDQFEPGTDFVAWSFAIARIEVLRYRQRFARQRMLFNDEVLEQLAQETQVQAANIDLWQDTLASCLKRLADRDRDLIRLKYDEALSIKALAQRVGRPVQGMYKAMARIHAALAACTKRHLKEEQA